MIKQTDLLRQLIHRDLEEQQEITIEDLTRFLNRRIFNQSLEQEWSRGLQGERPLSIILASVDALKVCDHTSCSLGIDRHLQQIVQELQRLVYRASDLVWRCGAEEFGIILPHTSVESAIRVATRIQNALKDFFENYNSIAANKPITLSYGLSGLIPCEGRNPIQLLEAAEIALFQAKGNGRNGIAVHLIE
jgi:diguanylate cyclase (GGDEF)-like protein